MFTGENPTPGFNGTSTREALTLIEMTLSWGSQISHDIIALSALTAFFWFYWAIKMRLACDYWAT